MAKTEHRKKWEESLPERIKVLRLHLKVLKAGIKRDKMEMKYALDEDMMAFLKRSVNAQNVVIRAIKRDLDYCGNAKVKPSGLGFECAWCHGRVQITDKYCWQCGKKLNWSGITVGSCQSMFNDAVDYLTKGRYDSSGLKAINEQERSGTMTPKELYKLAKAAGAENFTLEVRIETKNLVSVSQPMLDYISHGERVIVLTNNYK